MDTPPNSTPSDSAAPAEAPAEQRKPRAVLSCITCRNRKLRCDRGRPCHNCSKRNQACRYYTFPPSGRDVPSAPLSGSPRATKDLDRRLQHLEDLLLVLNDQQGVKRRKSSSTVLDDTGADDFRSAGDEEIDFNFPSDGSSSENTGATGLRKTTNPTSQGRQAEITPGNWQAVLDDISELRSFLLREGSSDGIQRYVTDCAPPQNPVLLLNTISPSTKPDLLASVPPKAVVDQLISKVLSCGEPAVLIFHAPTLMNEYNAFWKDPDSMPVAWLAKLFGLLCLATVFERRQGASLPHPLEEGEDTIDFFRARAAQCLIMANYTRPGPHKIEALIVYMASEYFKSKDVQLGISMIMGIIVRLSMSMGYHRDPSREANVSVFEGEMIRRRWAFITQVERLISFQMGLPSMVNRFQTDTRPPHNILDSDIDPSTNIMPPERPEWERTPISYIIAKERMIKAFGMVFDSLNSSKPIPYKGVMQLDVNLQKVRSLLPPHYQIQPLSQSYYESADLIMKRYFFELLFLKGRCVLHRQYLTHDTTDPRYSASRSMCLDAARQILRHQADIYRATQPSGILAACPWFVTSASASDFLLAAMIICLAISQQHQLTNADHDAASLGFPAGLDVHSSLLQELATSQRIWMTLSQKSAEASRAAEAIGLMLAQAHSAVQSGEGGGRFNDALSMNVAMPTTLADDFTAGAAGSMTSVVDVNAGFDWDSWDRYFQIVPMFPAPTTIDPQISSATAVDPVLAQTMPQEMPPLDAFSNLTFAGGSSTFPGQGFDIPC